MISWAGINVWTDRRGVGIGAEFELFQKSISLTHFLGLPLGRFGPVGIGLGW